MNEWAAVLNDSESLQEDYLDHASVAIPESIKFYNNFKQKLINDPNQSNSRIHFNILTIIHRLMEQEYLPRLGIHQHMTEEQTITALLTMPMENLTTIRDFANALCIRRRHVCEFIRTHCDHETKAYLEEVHHYENIDHEDKVRLIGAINNGFASYFTLNNICDAITEWVEEFTF